MIGQREYQILKHGTGMVGGSQFTVGANQANNFGINRVFQENGQQAPDLMTLIYTIILGSAFGSTGEKSLIITPTTSSPYDKEIASAVEERLNDYLEIQNKIAMLGRIYMTFGEIAVEITEETLTDVPIKFYDISENPYEFRRIEYKERLIGYYKDGLPTKSNIIFVFDKLNYEYIETQVQVTVNTINEENKSSFEIVDNKNNKKHNEDYQKKSVRLLDCKEVRGVSRLENAAGLADLFSTSMADAINSMDDLRPKQLVIVKTGQIKDVTARNDAFQKVVNSSTSRGNIEYIEAAEGIDIETQNITEGLNSNVLDELDFKYKQAANFAYISQDILNGEKSPFEDERTLQYIKDIRGAVLSVIERIITSEFGNDTLNHIRLRIQSNTEKEWESKIETLTKAVEVTTSITDLATFSKQKIKDGALSYVSNIVGVDFGEILEDIKTVDEPEDENHEEDTENFDGVE